MLGGCSTLRAQLNIHSRESLSAPSRKQRESPAGVNQVSTRDLAIDVQRFESSSPLFPSLRPVYSLILGEIPTGTLKYRHRRSTVHLGGPRLSIAFKRRAENELSYIHQVWHVRMIRSERPQFATSRPGNSSQSSNAWS
jgi:hypothetical protein